MEIMLVLGAVALIFGAIFEMRSNPQEAMIFTWFAIAAWTTAGLLAIYESSSVLMDVLKRLLS